MRSYNNNPYLIFHTRFYNSTKLFRLPHACAACEKSCYAHFGFPVTQQESVRNQCALAVNKRTKRLLAYTHTHTHTGAAKPGSPASGISQLPRCSGPFVSVSHCPLASIYVGGRMETCCFVLFKEACPFRLMPHPCSFFYFLFVLFQERTCWFI